MSHQKYCPNFDAALKRAIENNIKQPSAITSPAINDTQTTQDNNSKHLDKAKPLSNQLQFFTPSTSIFSTKTQASFTCNQTDFFGVYNGKGRKGKQDFIHAVFNNNESAEKFADYLDKNKLVQQKPNVNPTNKKSPNYPKNEDGTNKYFVRIHIDSYITVKNHFDSINENIFPKLSELQEYNPGKLSQIIRKIF